jgi:hypothetical protein
MLSPKVLTQSNFLAPITTINFFLANQNCSFGFKFGEHLLWFSPKEETLVCLDAEGIERVGCLVGRAPTTFAYMQAVALLRALGGARER